jgi:hypothetical protein
MTDSGRPVRDILAFSVINALRQVPGYMVAERMFPLRSNMPIGDYEDDDE